MSVNLDTLLEWSSVICGLLYLILIIYEKIWCWFFGILGSALSIWLFYRTQLYSESILYIYYVIIGFYGWYIWSKKSIAKAANDLDLSTDSKSTEVQESFKEWPILHHLISILSCGVLSLGVGYLFSNYTNARSAYLDAFTTVFSFFASFLEAKKVVSAWLYWIILNGITIYLYDLRELDKYKLLTVVYFVASFIGFYQWNKKYQLQKS
ncbi:nicotinamide riboside transporter PnuC [Parvicella tangerina]|uniref:Nicotinamide riboside transporter PnuC n=1 Tax=Parvicella tangerina TaxID=2829795 RepID=A0A916JPH0_9FLAO|nr:nicotinamide riboside transporter PnuC [Parvicella tangerina]CAG5086216.1 hypothetical protein CRYO30217_03047 [Parvicella tangerina]